MSNRVLVIDDSLPVHRLIHSHLAEQGVDCLSAYDGERGIALAAMEHPSLILLDVDLPNADGFEICARLRANSRTARIPVIFLTADFNTADKIRGLELGAVDYITKPCNFKELTARVKSAIRMRQLADDQAMRDSITGLWSKSYLDHHLQSRIAQARRSGQALSCIVADIDDLARINERYGRGIGDDVICEVSQALANKLLQNDVACACGGGTFALLGFGSDRHAAARVAMRHASTFHRKSIDLGGKVGPAISCCFGVADAEIARGENLIERAETAMRRAKKNGPGSVSVARPHRAVGSEAAGFEMNRIEAFTTPPKLAA